MIHVKVKVPVNLTGVLDTPFYEHFYSWIPILFYSRHHEILISGGLPTDHNRSSNQ